MATPPIPDTDPTPSHNGKRKIKISARVTDNADPLLPKNKKARTEGHMKIMGKEKVVKPRPKMGKTQRRPSVEVEDVPEEGYLHAGLHPKDPNHIIEPVTVGTIDVDEDPSNASAVNISDTELELEAAEESCEAELSK